MKKEELIQKLEFVKDHSPVVSIDKVIALIQQLEVERVFGITQDLAEDIARRIERCLDNNSDNLVNTDDAEFELSYDNRIELSRVEVNVYEIIEHVTACLEEFVEEEDEEEATEEGVLRDIEE